MYSRRVVRGALCAFRFRSAPFTWLYRTARNVCHEFNRKRRTGPLLLGDTLKETGRSDEALEVLQQGLRENVKAASR